MQNLSSSTSSNSTTVAGMMSSSSPLTSIYGSNMSASSDTLNNTSNTNSSNNNNSNNNNNNNNIVSAPPSTNNTTSDNITNEGNLLTKISAHSASHSALAAAAALQSLNQSHIQRAHQAQQQQHYHSSTTSSIRPSSSTSSSIATNLPTNLQLQMHGNSMNMPKLGVTSTTSSDHQNHNHLALSAVNQQPDNNPDFNVRFQQQQQQQKLPPGIRQPTSWQEQAAMAAANMNNGAPPRWLFQNPNSFQNPNLGQQTLPPNMFPPNSVNPMSNSNIMIGQDGDSHNNNNNNNNNNNPTSRANSRAPSNNERQQFPAGVGPLNLDGKNHPGQMKQQQQPPNPWLEGFKGITIPQLETNKSLQQHHLLQQQQQQQQQHHQQRAHDEMERLQMFTFNLYNTYIPGTNKPKKVIPLDSSEGLRQSIINGEFYSRYENIALDILQNQVIIPEFNIIDYIRRDKSSLHEIEKIDSVHKRLGISPLFSLLELAQPKPPPQNSSLLMKTSDSRLQPMPENIQYGNMDMRSTEQALLDQQIQNVLRNSAYYRELTGGPLPSLTSDRNRRSSQSPIDNLSSRSHSLSNNNTSGLNSSRNLPGNMNPSSIPNQINAPPYQPAGMSSTHGPNSQIHPNQRNQTLAHSKPIPPLNPASSFYNPTINPSRPPPRSQSTVGPGMSCRSPQSPYSAYPLRCPPQAHQNSVKSTIDLDLANDHLNLSSKGPPLSAHQSSRTPQLPKIPVHESLPPLKQRPVNTQLSPPGVRGDEKIVNRMHVPPMSSHLSANLQHSRSDIDPVSGLPLNTILNIRQQEMAMRNAGNMNIATNQPIGVSVPSNDHIRLSTSRPSSNPQMPPIYSMHNQLSNANNGPMLGPRSQQGLNNPHNSSMPPPISDHHKNVDSNGFKGSKSAMSPGPNANDSPSDAQLQQYSAYVMSCHQQQLQMQHDLLMASQTSLSSSVHNPSHHNLDSPAESNPLQINTTPLTSEAMLMDMNRRGSLSNDGRVGSLSQQPSPRQSNQRSIITGSASGPPKKGKKVKHSPPISQLATERPSNTPSDFDNSLMPVELMDTSRQNIQLKESNESNIDIDKQSSVPPVGTAAVNFSNNDIAAYKGDMNISNECSKSAIGSISDANESSTDLAKTAAQNRGAAPVQDQAAARDSLKHDHMSSATEIGQHKNTEGNIPFNELEISKMANSVSSYGNVTAHSVLASDNTIVTNPNSGTNAPKSPSVGHDNSSSTSDSNIKTPAQSEKTVEPQSKYQKFHTKKAWLKNYDLEDQSRSQNNEISENVPLVSKCDNKSEALDSTTSSSKPGSPKTNSVTKPAKTLKRKKKSIETPSSKTKSNKTPKQSRPTKTADNDSGAHTSSTSELDTDDEDAMGVKKLRQMPRRKVKPTSTNNNSNSKNGQQQPSPKSKTPLRENSRKKIKKESAAEEQTKEKKDKSLVQEDDSADRDGQNKDVALQLEPCFELVPKNIRCLECRRIRVSSTKGDKVQSGKNRQFDDFCRFYAFRKLDLSKSSQPVVAGFSDLNDVTQEDKNPWLPQKGVRPTCMNLKVAKFILANVGDQFCNMTMQERATQSLYQTQKEGDKKITWKRAVMGLRELCDACATTLFNCHYVCEKCGFVVCIECYQSRASDLASIQSAKSEIPDIKEDKDSDKLNPPSTDSNENSLKETVEQQPPVVAKRSKRDTFGWIYCTRNEKHCHEKLTLSQIITSDCIEQVWTLLHDIRERYNLGSCICKRGPAEVKIEGVATSDPPSTWLKSANGTHSTLKGLLLASSSNDAENSDDSSTHSSETDCNLQIHEEEEDVKTDIPDDQMFSDSSNHDDGPSEDMELVKEQVTKTINDCIAALPTDVASSQISVADSKGSTEIDVCSIGYPHKIPTQSSESQSEIDVCNTQKTNNQGSSQSEVDVCGTDSQPKVKTEISGVRDETHSWLCGSELLVLSEAHQVNNIRLFRKQWVQGKPVVVRGVDRLMEIEMWLPQYFGKQFGDYRSDLVDCRNGDIHRHSMKKYWDGFEPSSATIKRKTKEDPFQAQTTNNDESSNGPSYYSGSALWRLKDWPPGQDFFDILPEHYVDFMNNLPLKPYTTRTGFLNLAFRLPENMLKPDLGPKMYSAYGTSKFPDRGTTNLHLDISDAINVMIYVNGATSFNKGSDESRDSYEKTVMDCHIDQKMKDEIITKKLVPGALWHVFKPCDAPKMREFLNKVSEERNISPDKRTDPIHDQTWYLDQTLLDRLHEEQGVKPYAILQCMGDAILIPAGAPHQVKNLQNCIKVANDFVSPENVEFCLQLTNEFRSLPETHMNQEDKLQIKNILYHSVKQCLQYVQAYESGEIDTEDNIEDDEELDMD